MVFKKEELSFDGEASGLTDEMEAIAQGFREIAEAEDVVIKATAALGTKGFNQLKGTIKTVTKAGDVMSQRFKVLAKDFDKFDGSAQSLQTFLERLGGTIKIDTEATKRLADASVMCVSEANGLDQAKIDEATESFLADRAARAASGNSQGSEQLAMPSGASASA